MIFITISTYQRFWQFALGMLCLANADLPEGAHVEVVDDGTSDGSAEAKLAVLDDLRFRDIVQEYEFLPANGRKNALFNRWMARVLADPSVELWLHQDDDLCFASDMLIRMVDDYRNYLARGVLYGFVNGWRDIETKLRVGHCNGPLHHIKELGGASFLQSRSTLQAVGNFFADPRNRAGREERLWEAYRRANETLAFNRDNPYQVQHSANAESVLSGHQESWRHCWSRDVRTGQLIEVQPYGTKALRAAVDSGQLEQFVRAANEKAAEKVLLPN